MDLLTLLFQIASQIGQVLNRQENLLQAIRNIANSVVDQAVEHTPFQIETTVVATSLNVANPTYGLAAIKTELDAVSAQLVALGAPQQTGSPVTLPTVPPAGYGGASGSSIAAAVWGAVSDDEATQYGTIVAAQSAWLRVFGASGAMPARISERATFNFDPFALIGNAFVSFPEITPASILSTHTSTLAWLNDVYPIGTWHNTGYDTYWANVSSPAGNALVTIEMTPSEFAWYRANADALILPSPTAPVWPGISGVSLLTPFDLADGLIITEAMDGVIVAITSVTSRTQLNPYGTVQSYGHIGALSFADDEGGQEDFQYLTFANQVYSPRTMKQAASIAFRVKPGIVGTVTPWTLI